MPSRREMIRMTPQEVETFLEAGKVLNLASLGPNGNVHLVAMWYGFLDGELCIETFAKSQKVKNFKRDPRFTGLVEDGETYNTLRGVELVGEAEILEDREAVEAACRAVLPRYQEFADEQELDAAAAFAANKRFAVKLHVNQVVSWDHTKLDVAY